MVGAHLVRRLLEEEAGPVHVLSRHDAPPLRLGALAESPALHFHRCDLTDAASVTASLAQIRPAVVFHLASTPFNPPPAPGLHIDVNLHGMLNLLDACRAHPPQRFIYTSSAAIYGAGSGLTEYSPCRPGTLLGISKLAAGLLLHAEAKRQEFHATELRLFTPFGPGERAGRLIPGTILSLLKGEPIRLGPGTQTRDYLYIDDVTEALLAARSAPPPPAGEDAVYNICSGEERSVREVAETIRRLMGLETPIHLDPSAARPDEIWRLGGDNSRARTALGWEPKISFEEGLQRSIAWVTNNRNLAERCP